MLAPLALLIALIALIRLTTANAVQVFNGCNFPIYVRSALSGSPDSAESTLPGGQTYFSPSMADNGAGLTVKVSRCPSETSTCPALQLEAAQGSGLVYFDLSAIDGNPFDDVRRVALTDWGCCNIGWDCEPGSWNDGCSQGTTEWKPCPEHCGDVLLVMC
jgi:hypothetical protein